MHFLGYCAIGSAVCVSGALLVVGYGGAVSTLPADPLNRAVANVPAANMDVSGAEESELPAETSERDLESTVSAIRQDRAIPGPSRQVTAKAATAAAPPPQQQSDVVSAVREANATETSLDSREVSGGAMLLVDELEIAIPAGQPMPLAVAVSARDEAAPDGYNEQHKALAEGLTADFAAEIATQSAPGKRSGTLHPSLLSLQGAANRADERFRALFGHDIYNREIIRQNQTTY